MGRSEGEEAGVYLRETIAKNLGHDSASGIPLAPNYQVLRVLPTTSRFSPGGIPLHRQKDYGRDKTPQFRKMPNPASLGIISNSTPTHVARWLLEGETWKMQDD